MIYCKRVKLLPQLDTLQRWIMCPADCW